MTTVRRMRSCDWSRPVHLLRESLDFLREHSDRSDPVDETVLCMLESAWHAATAADRTRWDCGPAETDAAMRDMLAAARAAVVTASFALVQESGPRTPGGERCG
jgi:hypothetical protein